MSEIHLYPELTRATRRMLAESDNPMSRYAAELIRMGAECATASAAVMHELEEHGAAIVPHLMDSDENAGERLRCALAEARAAGLVDETPCQN